MMQASLSAVPLKLQNSVPKYMDLRTEREFSVMHGCTEFSRSTYSQQNPNSTNVNILCNPPGAETLIHPIVWKKATVKFTSVITNTTTNNVVNPYRSAANKSKLIFRSFPLEQIIQNEEFLINQNSFTVTRMPDYSDCMHRFANSVDDKINEFSLTPSQVDEFTSYDFGALTNKDPFAEYGGTQIGESRHAFFTKAIIDHLSENVNVPARANNVDGTLTRTFTVDIMEPVKISPFYYQPFAITGVDQLQYRAQFANLDRMFCLSSALDNAVSYANTISIERFELHFSFTKPKLLSGLPSQIVYPYQQIDYSSMDEKEIAIANGESAELDFNFNQLNLTGVPRRMIIWISEKSGNYAGAAGRLLPSVSKSLITNININYNGRPGILGDASQEDLYDIAKKNGLNLSYKQYSQYVGSYLALNFGEEIPLGEGEAPGSSGAPQLSFKVKAKNIGAASARFELNCAIIYEGTCAIIRGGGAIKQTAVITAQDVYNALQSDDYQISEHLSFQPNKFGGNPLALLGSLSSVLPIARTIRGIIQKGAPIVKGIADGAESIGLGRAGKMAGSVVTTGKIRRDDDDEDEYEMVKVKKGKSKKGGAVITRNQLYSDMY